MSSRIPLHIGVALPLTDSILSVYPYSLLKNPHAARYCVNHRPKMRGRDVANYLYTAVVGQDVQMPWSPGMGGSGIRRCLPRLALV